MIKTLLKRLERAKVKKSKVLVTVNEAVKQLEESSTEIHEVISEIREKEITLALQKSDAKQLLHNTDELINNIKKSIGGILNV